MDDFLDQYFSSSSWSVQNVAERSSWISNGPVETNGILPNAFGAYKGDSKNSPISLIPPSHIIENLTSQDTAILGVGDGSNYALGNGLLPRDSVLTKESLDCETNSSLSEMMNGNSKYTGVLLSNPTPNLVNHSSPELVPVIGSCARSPRAQVESGSVGSNDSETSGYQPSLRDPRSLNSIPQLWTPSSFGDSSSLSPLTAQDKLPIFGLQGEYMDSDANMLSNRYLGDDKILQMGNPPASVHLNGHGELNNECMSSLPTGHHNQLAQMVGLHPQPQLNEGNHSSHYPEQSSVSQLQHTAAMAAGGCNGTAKPRMRARRGQATDPHSIAERLRREKIAERMKNLQELVPNSNKTDKASMLDEIIEYVKFLQLQVKVLSMSRLGAAGAVVPLITDKTEVGSNGLLLPQPDDQESEPFDPLAFEQEVVKLMESDVTTAMQFLQSKGLCLMPIALATAMSSRKASSGPTSIDTKKPISRNGFAHQGNGEVGSKEVGNGCNGNVNKLEEASNLPCDDARELKPRV